jgi:alanine dehydrogenase
MQELLLSVLRQSRNVLLYQNKNVLFSYVKSAYSRSQTELFVDLMVIRLCYHCIYVAYHAQNICRCIDAGAHDI